MRAPVRSIAAAAFLAACGLFGASPVEARVVYVSSAGSSANTGLSWEAAKRLPSQALSIAVPGDQVWVAAGNYIDGISLKNGVSVFGGFAGHETDLEQRDWRRNPTTLLGLDWEKAAWAQAGTNASARVDGFRLEASIGVHCQPGSSPTIANNTIARSGTGIYIDAGASPTVCGNDIRDGSPGIMCDNAGGSITGNRIQGNYSGGIICRGQTTTMIANNMILANSSDRGGGIYVESSSPSIINNTLYANDANVGGGLFLLNSPQAKVINNIVAGGSSGICVQGDPPLFSHNCVSANADYAYSGVPDQTGYGGNIGGNPLLANPGFGNAHITEGSPCRDAGLNSAAQAGWTDFDGAARFADSSVDIGADEYEQAAWPTGAPVIIRIREDGNDSADGLTWETAKRSLFAGASAAEARGGEVWVKQGVYTAPPMGLRIAPFVRIYGGFDGSEGKRGGNWQEHPTTINWGFGDQTVIIGPGYRACSMEGFTVGVDPDEPPLDCYIGLMVAGSPSVSNCVVRDCDTGVFLSQSRARVYGLELPGNRYAIQCYKGAPWIHNCRITSAGQQEGLRCDASSPTVSTCLFTGYVTAVHALTGGTPRIVNCTIADCQGGVTVEHTGAEISNSIIAYCNSGIYGYGQPTITARNNDLFGCTSPYVQTPDRTGQDGNLAVDPLFGGRSSGDYHIRADSPCRDAGLNAAVQTDWGGDLDNQRRIQGIRVDIGAYELYPPTLSAGALRTAPDEAFVLSEDMAVTVVLGDVFYAQSPDRSAGLQVLRAGHGLGRGSMVRLEGILHTSTEGEKWLEARDVAVRGMSDVLPLALCNRDLGGGAFRFDARNGQGQRGMTGQAAGLNNVGLFVATSGRVLEVDTLSGAALISDASRAGGVRILAPGIPLPAVGEFVLVTGASSCTESGGATLPAVRVDRPTDLRSL